MTTRLAAILLLGQLLVIAVADAGAPDPASSGAPGFCSTWEAWRARVADPEASLFGSCAPLGICDDPAVRDRYLLDASSPILTVRVHVIVFGGAATEASVDATMDQVNLDYAPHRIRFVHTFESVAGPLDRANADTPWNRINVFIEPGFGGVGTFPWDPIHSLADGGIWLGADGVVPPNRSILSHELGHNLGLWHTHHGVDETVGCSDPCYERADGVDGDTTGDLCSDTPSTPLNPDCFDPGGLDSCSSTAWGVTLPKDYMSYGALNLPGCWNHFTPQQAARFRCWTLDVLGGWLNDVVIYRGLVPALVPGWKATALPLSDGNDDETAPFPVSATRDNQSTDAPGSDQPLVLYRMLGNGIASAGNALRVVKSVTVPDAIVLHY